jgi:hypothetical protein
MEDPHLNTSKEAKLFYLLWQLLSKLAIYEYCQQEQNINESSLCYIGVISPTLPNEAHYY